MTKISLNKASQKLGEQRRKVASLQQKRSEAVASWNAASDKIEEFQSKHSGELTSEQQTELSGLIQAASEARKTVQTLTSEIASESTALATMEEDFNLLQEHNNTEDQLSSSVGNSFASDVDGEDETGASPQNNVRVLPPTQEQLDYDMGVMFQCSIVAAADRCSPAEVAQELFGNERVANAMSANKHSAGGSWIHGEYSERFIDQLRPESVVRAAGVDSVPIEDGTLTMSKEIAGPKGKYLGEKEPADSEEVTTGDVQLIAKELVVQVPITEKLARSTSARATARVRQSIFAGAGETEDLYFLRGAKSSAGPTGMRFQIPDSGLVTANTTINVQNVDDDLGSLELVLRQGNVKMRKPAWFMSPRSLIFLTNLRDGNGHKVYPELSSGEKPMLRRKPVFVTTQIPDIIGGAGNGSEVYLADADTLLIGDAPRVQFDASRDAAYNSGGTVKTAFSNREIVMRLVIENDLALLHDAGVAVLNDVRWGA